MADLVFAHAPVLHQDVDATGKHSLGGKSDFVTTIDFDGDWNTSNNWENIERKVPLAACYYSVSETATHWFILYCFYHPRDWADDPLTEVLGIKAFEHENDLEGMLAIVARPAVPGGSPFGEAAGDRHRIPSGFLFIRAGFQSVDFSRRGYRWRTPAGRSCRDCAPCCCSRGQRAWLEGNSLRRHRRGRSCIPPVKGSRHATFIHKRPIGSLCARQYLRARRALGSPKRPGNVRELRKFPRRSERSMGME